MDVVFLNSEKKINSAKTAAVIGLGRMGQAHIEALLQLGIEIIALCDISEQKLLETCAKWQLETAKRYQSSEDLFMANQKPDLLMIATTADMHCALTCAAAEAKIKMILCEKPLARSLEECDRMMEACNRAESRLAVNHQMRFIPQYVLPKQELNTPQFGTLSSMTVVGGCFGLAMNGSHYIEAFNYLTESKPYEITAWFSEKLLPNPRGVSFLDRAGQLRVTSENGKRLFMEMGSDQGHGMTSMYATQFGHVFVDELEGEMICVARQEEFLELPVTRYGSPWNRWKKQFKPFDNVQSTKMVLSALLEGENYPDLQTGRDIIAVLVAAYHSDENKNRSVYVDDNTLPYDRVFPWA